MEEGRLVKVSGGLYRTPKKTRFGEAPADPAKLIERFLKDDRFLLVSPNAYNALGVGATQLPIAVTRFRDEEKAPQPVAAIVRADLERSGMVRSIDVAGVLDGDKVVRALKGVDIEEMILQHKVSGGMVLKLEAAKRALAAGVTEVRIIGGNVPRGLLAAANGMRFPGTRVKPMFPVLGAQQEMSFRAKRGVCS